MTFYITGVQLEVGDTATSFEHRSIERGTSTLPTHILFSDICMGPVTGYHIG